VIHTGKSYLKIILITLFGIQSFSVLYARTMDQYFVDETHLRLPVDSDFSRDVDLIDIDGDGDLDAFITNSDRYGYAHRCRLYMNDGAGYFVDETTSRLPVEYTDTRGTALADFDGDNDYDIVLASASGDPNLIWMNIGDGYFVDETSSRLPEIPGDIYFFPETGDLDGDGDFDFMLSGADNPSRIFINDGSGFFTDETEARLPASSEDLDWTNGFVFFDPDLDGDLDVFETNREEVNRLLFNDGEGFFSDVTAERVPEDYFVTRPGVAVDFNQDGFLDLALPITHAVRDQIWMNYGGVFYDETAGRFPDIAASMKCVASADIDNDSWHDLIFGSNDASTPFQNILFMNTGSGYFENVTDERLPRLEDQTQDIIFGDIDGDGDVDLIMANIEEQNRLYINIGSPDAHPPQIIRPLAFSAIKIEPGPFSVNTHVIDNVSVNVGELEVSLFYSADGGGTFSEVFMDWRGGELYIGEIPEQPSGTLVQYYFQAVDRAENISTDPADAPVETYKFVVGRLGHIRP
jgi:hypothetical protein